MKKCASILALFGIFQCTYCFYPRYSRCLSSGIPFSRDSIAITIGQFTPRFQNKCNRNFKLNRKGFPFESFRSKIDPSDVFGNARFMNSTEVREALRSPLVELGLAGLVLSGCLLFALQTLPWDQATASRLALAEDAISGAFVTEYIARWYSRNFRPSYILKIEMIVDFLAVLPLILRAASLKDVKGLTFLRVLRVLRLQRFFLDAESFQLFADSLPSIFGSGFKVKPYQLQVYLAGTRILSLLSWRAPRLATAAEQACARRPAIAATAARTGGAHRLEHLRATLHHRGPRLHRRAGCEPEDPRLLHRLLLRPDYPDHRWLWGRRPGATPHPHSPPLAERRAVRCGAVRCAAKKRRVTEGCQTWTPAVEAERPVSSGEISL